jgi:protein SCO1/2
MKAFLFAMAAAAALPLAAGAQAGHERLPAAEAAAADDSVYLLGGAFENQEGEIVRLEHFAGRPVLIAMFYATCPHACPMLIADLKRIEQALPPEVRERLQVVLVTFDPARDTPEKMKALLEAHRVDASRWSMLRTDPAKVRELAAVLGIRYRFAKNGAIHHSSVIALLDEGGAIVERIEGLRQPVDPIVEKLFR